MMAVPSLWVAFGEVPAKEQFVNVHYRRAFLLLGRKSNLFWTRVTSIVSLSRSSARLFSWFSITPSYGEESGSAQPLVWFAAWYEEKERVVWFLSDLSN